MNERKLPEIVQQWLSRAQSDLHLGEAALEIPGVILEDACFHAQQCAEKALKGLLSYYEIPYPRTHILEVLIDLLKETDVEVPDFVDQAYILTQYAVQTRYPGVWEPVMNDEANKALKLAAIVLRWVETKLE